MKLIDTLMVNWDSVLVIVLFVIFLFVLIKNGETKMLKQILFHLVTQAEKQLGSGTGALKYAVVSDKIYQRIPPILRLLFTEKDIATMIEAVLDEAKKTWGTNDNIKRYITPHD